MQFLLRQRIAQHTCGNIERSAWSLATLDRLAEYILENTNQLIQTGAGSGTDIKTVFPGRVLDSPNEGLGHVTDMNVVPRNAAITPDLDRYASQRIVEKDPDDPLCRFYSLALTIWIRHPQTDGFDSM